MLFILMAFFAILFRVLTILKLYKLVSVDTINREISLQNILTRQQKVFPLMSFDGYYDSVRRSNFGSHKEILLMQNNKAVNIISNEFNANYDVLLKSISDLNYLGTLKYNLKDKTAMLFNKEI